MKFSKKVFNELSELMKQLNELRELILNKFNELNDPANKTIEIVNKLNTQ